MRSNEQVTERLGAVDTNLAKIAADQDANAALLAEVAADIADLKTAATDAGLSDEVLARFDATASKVQAAAEAATSQVEALRGIAAQHTPGDAGTPAPPVQTGDTPSDPNDPPVTPVSRRSHNA